MAKQVEMFVPVGVKDGLKFTSGELQVSYFKINLPLT